MLENGAGRAVEVAFECNVKIKDDGDIPYAKAAEGSGEHLLQCLDFDKTFLWMFPHLVSKQ